MITAYTINSNIPSAVPYLPENAQNTGVPQSIMWLHLTDPTPQECDAISERYSIPREHLTAALDSNERPRMEFCNNILLALIRVPLVTGEAPTLPFRSCPVAAILTPHIFITICLKKNIVENMLCRKAPSALSITKERLLLIFFFRSSTTFIESLHYLDEQVEGMEASLRKSMQNHELLTMLHIDKTLIYFLTALKGNQSVLERIHLNDPLSLSREDKDFLDDVLIENKQATDMAEIFSQVMGSLSEAFGTIVSNNLNKVMRVLTGLTVLFMIPSVIGAFYGMNVALPLAENPYAFVGICLACAAITLATFFVLRKKNVM